MSFQPINPKPYLQSLVGKPVVIKLKFNNIEYHGKLLSIDNYMNLLLDKDVKEIDTAAETSTDLGDELFVRCNNVLWVGEKQDNEQPDFLSEPEVSGHSTAA
ncbi:uncharacterized protein OGAPODRAFT_7965 [Ogataea polymorpha]|uniref:uncharacterized protein n=1 Tax=Ogataea polymorpha TaxID=460523 RepID=UPI0007F49AEC|nr:uncharacterized protein OGAPODRAFT_7965 [Ogataea polymorpha]OBA16717.1 hypothetical protein OGAPODRAFT_7965 [Ogataea polymorpha]